MEFLLPFYDINIVLYPSQFRNCKKFNGFIIIKLKKKKDVQDMKRKGCQENRGDRKRIMAIQEGEKLYNPNNPLESKSSGVTSIGVTTASFKSTLIYNNCAKFSSNESRFGWVKMGI